MDRSDFRERRRIREEMQSEAFAEAVSKTILLMIIGGWIFGVISTQFGLGR